MRDFIIKNFWPKYRFRRVLDIDKTIFLSKRLLIFDIDNTLFFSETTETTQEVIDWFKETAQKYLCICLSNSWRIKKRQAVIRQKLECEVFISHYKKPSRRLFTEICQKYGVEPKEAVVIGDRVLTDVWFGNRNGAVTILVEPLRDKEYLVLKILRKLERGLLVLAKKF